MRTLIVVFAAALAAVSSPASPGPPRPDAGGDLPPAVIEVRLFDPYRLLTDEVEAVIREEAGWAFAETGVPVRFVRQAGGRVIPATVYPEIPEHWTRAPQAIGVAIGTPGGPRSVFLSVGAAERALGIPTPRRGPSFRDSSMAVGGRRLGVALGRVLAHELTHVIAPDCPHTTTGLMAPQLSRRDLTAPEFGFDDLATRYLREATTGGVG